MERRVPLRRTGFGKRGSPLRRNRRKPRGRPTDEQIAAKQRAACFLARFSDRPCSGQMRLCHLIPKERLRFYGVPESEIWDERVVCNGCDAHNAQCPDMEAVDPIRIPRDQLPPGLEEYAAEHEMTWWLDRAYGSRDDVQTAPEIYWPETGRPAGGGGAS